VPADLRSKVAQIVLPQCKAEEILTELHGGPSGGHLGVNKTLNKLRQRYFWLQARHDIEEWYCRCKPNAASHGSPGLMHQYSVRGPFERMILPSEQPRKPIPPDHNGLLPSGRRPMPFATKMRQLWWKHHLPTSSAALEYGESYTVSRAVPLSPA
jgi:hypothetical protein